MIQKVSWRRGETTHTHTAAQIVNQVTAKSAGRGQQSGLGGGHGKLTPNAGGVRLYQIEYFYVFFFSRKSRNSLIIKVVKCLSSEAYTGCAAALPDSSLTSLTSPPPHLPTGWADGGSEATPVAGWPVARPVQLKSHLASVIILCLLPRHWV